MSFSSREVWKRCYVTYAVPIEPFFCCGERRKEINRLRLFREPIRRGNSADGVGDVEAENRRIAVHSKACDPESHLLWRAGHLILNPPGQHPHKPVRQADDHELRWRGIRVIGCSQA